MTFDSCQGEERNIIFYSMVATRKQDLLNYIFPVELKNADELVGEKLKIQRLNVGFSRAQEMVSFVLSKPLAEFKGSIGQAMRHFQNLQRAHKADAEETDPLSPMEQKVLEWIYSTPFYQLRSESVEVLPQFPLGDYLRQLDPTYKHPSWRVDFLLSVDTETSVVYIVIEYDGFEYHFKKGAPVGVGNHERYLNEADVESKSKLYPLIAVRFLFWLFRSSALSGWRHVRTRGIPGRHAASARTIRTATTANEKRTAARIVATYSCRTLANAAGSRQTSAETGPGSSRISATFTAICSSMIRALTAIIARIHKAANSYRMDSRQPQLPQSYPQIFARL